MSKLKFKMDMQWFKFDALGFEKDMRKFLSDYNRDAGIVWLRAATDLVPLPVWSGATRASFRKLARALGVSISIGPRVSRKDRTSLGESTSTGNVIEDTSRNFYAIEWGSSLRYLNYNEFNMATPGEPPRPLWTTIKNTPYGFQEKALAAWMDFTRDVKLPDPLKEKFLKRFRIT